MRSATFRNVSFGILALALAYQVGASRAVAQAPGNPIVGTSYGSNGNVFAALASNGDSYISFDYGLTWQKRGNVFTGSVPLEAQHATFGAIKSRYIH